MAKVGWYFKNSNGTRRAVGKKPANPFGLQDMHGNVWEWCEDDWSVSYEESMEAHPGPFKRDPRAYSRVIRGGSFFDEAGLARSAFRYYALPSHTYTILGFRPAKGITTR